MLALGVGGVIETKTKVLIGGDSTFIESQNQRIIECFRLEGTFRCHLAQSHCSEQGHLKLDQVAQSPVQPGLG